MRGRTDASFGHMTSSRDSLSFPRRSARTQRFTLGAPRAFSVSPDGERVVFVRSSSGTDRSHGLWVLDLGGAGGAGAPAERLAADPRALLAGAEEELSAEERARRERSREGSGGIVGYAVDGAVELAAFALSGRLFVAELRAGTAGELPVPGPVVDPRPSPDGRYVAYAAGGALRVTGTDPGSAAGGDRALVEPEAEGVSYGLAEFAASEEMSRSRGFWWAPSSDRLLVARVDERPVRRWWIADPAHPERAPHAVAYPAAGTPNAEVGLFLVDLAGARTEVVWDRAAFPYLARVHWSGDGAPLLLVQARDQRTQAYLEVDPESGATREVRREEDPAWLELFTGVPARTPDGRLVRIADEGGARVLAVGERARTDGTLHVRAVLDVGAEDVLISASAGEAAEASEIGEIHVYRVGIGGSGGAERVSEGAGVHGAVRSGAVTVLSSARPDVPGSVARVLRDGKTVAEVASYAQTPRSRPGCGWSRRARGGSRARCCCPRAGRRATVRCRCSWTRTGGRTGSGWSPRTTRI